MLLELRRGLLFTVVAMAIVGLYHVGLWGLGRAVFPARAEGSLLRDANGTIVGSALIAQSFTRPEYFHPRPSAVDYNAASTGGSNYGPSNPDHLKAVADRLATVVTRERVRPEDVPVDLLTTSGAGLDPHISPAAANIQIRRVATARGVTTDDLRSLVSRHTEGPTFGFLGRPRVNVLTLNLALDATLGTVPVANGRKE